MTRPGDRLRALAARVCSADAMTRLIDPVIADMQVEHAEALRNGRVWRSRWVRLAGYIAFAKVLAMCEWSAAGDTHLLMRTVLCSVAGVALATAAFVAIPYYGHSVVVGFHQDRWETVVFLLPQALAVSIPVGAMIGISVGLAKQRMSVRLATLVAALALLWSVGSVVNNGWVVPAANQAFRTAAFRRFSPYSPPKGFNEMTFPELARKIAHQHRFASDHLDRGFTFLLEVDYYMRWALAFATLALALFTLSLLALSRRGWVIGIGTVGAIFGYYALLFFARGFAFNHHLSPPVAAWLPNAFFVVLSLALMMLSALRPTERRTLTSI